MKYEKLNKLSIRDHAQLSERWVQDRISEDPSKFDIELSCITRCEGLQIVRCKLWFDISSNRISLWFDGSILLGIEL
jgi:hypothetical protein